MWAPLPTINHLVSPAVSPLQGPAALWPRTESTAMPWARPAAGVPGFHSSLPESPEEEGLISQGVGRQHRDTLSVSGAHRGLSLVLTGFSQSQWPRIPECTGPLDGLLRVTSRTPQQGLLGSWLPDDPRAPTPVIQRRVSRESMEPCAGLATKMPGQCREAY